MRQVIQFLLGKFGAQNNSEINELVSGWYNHDFQVKDVDVSLRDVSENVVVRTLDHAINAYGLSMEDMSDLALLPCLSDSKCDFKLRIYPLSNLIMAKLSNLCALTVDSWSVDDDVLISDASELITVTKNGFNPSIEGMFINGTMIDDQENFSVYLNKDEILGITEFINNTMLNGVQICDYDLLMKVVERSLFYRLVDSYVGFNLSMEEPELIDVVKMMVASQCDGNSEKNGIDPKVYASWGERIGIAYTRFDISDIKKAQDSATPAKKQHLKVVVNNEIAEPAFEEATNGVCDDDAYCTEWGAF